MRILVVRAGALGDVILTIPALRALRARYREARIEVVGYPNTWRVVGPLVDVVTSVDSPAVAGLYLGSLTSELTAWLEQADLAVAWSIQDFAPVLRAAGIPDVIATSPYPPPGVHAAHWLLESVSNHDGFLSQADPWRLNLDADELTRGRAVLERLGLMRPVILHPGAGAAWKRWPAQRFAAVGDALVRYGLEVLLIEGPADEVATAAVQRCAAHPFPVLRDGPPRDLGAVLAHGAVFAGNDSGVSHLAAALGVPTIALFGPTDPVSWRPLGPVRVLRACQIRARWQGHIRVCEDERCMEGIAVDEVMNEVVSALHGRV